MNFTYTTKQSLCEDYFGQIKYITHNGTHNITASTSFQDLWQLETCFSWLYLKTDQTNHRLQRKTNGRGLNGVTDRIHSNLVYIIHANTRVMLPRKHHIAKSFELSPSNEVSNNSFFQIIFEAFRYPSLRVKHFAVNYISQSVINLL